MPPGKRDNMNNIDYSQINFADTENEILGILEKNRIPMCKLDDVLKDVKLSAERYTPIQNCHKS